MLLSVFIPFYNEEKRLKNSAETVYSYLSNKFPSDQFEFLLVNDGSSDNSLAIAQEFLRKASPYQGEAFIRIISHEPPNRGKGWAVREGMLAAKGDWVLFLDCDFATPIEEFDKFLPYIQKRSDLPFGLRVEGRTSKEIDILIGTRRVKESQIKTRQPIYREIMGKAFYYLTRLLLSIKVSDVTCGFKCYSKKAVQMVFPQQKLLDWSFDAEDLFLAQKQNLKIKEIPVFWQDKNMSRVRVFKDALKSIQGLLKIRLSD